MAKKKKKRLPPSQEAPLKGVPERATPERIEQMVLKKRDGPKGKSRLEPPPDAMDNNQFIRYSAGIYYATDFQGATLSQMSKHQLFGKVSVDTLANWSTQDRWVERRKANMDNWRHKIEAHIGNELVKMMSDMLKSARTAFDKAVNEIARPKLKAQTFEGAVRAMVQSGEFIMTLEEKLFRTVIPDIPVASVSGTLSKAAATSKPRLTVPEARMAAVAILESRRNEMRAEAARAQAEKDGTKPDLQVVQGEGHGDNANGAGQGEGGDAAAAAGQAVRQHQPPGPQGKA